MQRAGFVTFPGARYDDQVDSLSQYFGWVRERPPSLFEWDMGDEGPVNHDLIAERLCFARGGSV
jgi:hypothetical protein